MAKNAQKTPTVSKNTWPAKINLQERVPVGHERAGYPRFGLINDGKGRMCMIHYKIVPQNLVDAALQAQADVVA